MPRTKRVPKPNKKYVEGENEDVTVTTFAVKSPPEVEDEKIDEEEKEYDSASDLEEEDAIKPGELVPGKGYVKDTEKMSPMTKVPGVATKIDHVTPSPPVEKNTKRESSDISAPLERCGENTTTEASIYVLRVNGGEFTIRLSTTLANEYIRSMGGENKFDIIKSFQSLPEAKKFIIDCTAPGNKDSQQEQGASVTAALPANKKPRVENGGAALPFGISPFSNGGDFSAQTQKKKYGSNELDELTKYIQNNNQTRNIMDAEEEENEDATVWLLLQRNPNQCLLFNCCILMRHNKAPNHSVETVHVQHGMQTDSECTSIQVTPPN